MPMLVVFSRRRRQPTKVNDYLNFLMLGLFNFYVLESPQFVHLYIEFHITHGYLYVSVPKPITLSRNY